MTDTTLKLVSIIPRAGVTDAAERLTRQASQALSVDGRAVVETATVVRWCEPAAAGQGVAETGDVEPVSLVEAWFRTAAGRPPSDGLASAAEEVGAWFASWATERIHIPPQAPRPGGVLRVAVIRRAADMSRDEFDRHWNGHHVPLVRAHRPLFSAYVTNVIDDPRVTWDGIVEQWFSDRDQASLHVEQSLHDKPAVAEDILRMVSHVIPYDSADAAWRPASFD